MSVFCRNYAEFLSANMVDYSYRMTEEVKTSFLSDFANKLHHDWLKSKNPEVIMKYEQSDDVLIIPNKSLYCQSSDNYVIFNWCFKVFAKGKCVSLFSHCVYIPV